MHFSVTDSHSPITIKEGSRWGQGKPQTTQWETWSKDCLVSLLGRNCPSALSFIVNWGLWGRSRAEWVQEVLPVSLVLLRRMASP